LLLLQAIGHFNVDSKKAAMFIECGLYSFLVDFPDSQPQQPKGFQGLGISSSFPKNMLFDGFQKSKEEL